MKIIALTGCAIPLILGGMMVDPATDDVSSVIPIDEVQLTASIDKSDDYLLYKEMFTASARTLVKKNKCTFSDYEKGRGWKKFQHHPQQPIYTMTCGEGRQLFLDAQTGEIFKTTKSLMKHILAAKTEK